ncbi:magnesium and cobalt transport protein CorA [Micrococcales bacterium 31B]|nr:magnesium and cobalt transport protein CorA [Micrococcales bacterium 31B]
MWLPSRTPVTTPDDLAAAPDPGETLWLHAHLGERLRGAHRRLIDADALREWLDAPVLGGLHDALTHRTVTGDSSTMFDWRTVSFRDSDAQVLTTDIVVWRSHEALVTVSAGENDALQHLLHDMQHAAARLTTPHRAPAGSENVLVSSVIAHLVRTSISDFLDVEQRLADALSDIENLVFREGTDDDLGLIYRLKREVLEAQRAALNNLTSFDALPANLFKAPDLRVESPARTLPRSTKDRVLSLMEQIARRLSDSSSLISDIVNVHLNKVSVQQNDDMRRISAYAAMVAVPTFIAGLYGMNFDHMPELHWTFGYPLCVAFMAVSTVVLYRLFKRSGWL